MKAVFISSFVHKGRVWRIMTPERRTNGYPFFVRADDDTDTEERFVSSAQARSFIKEKYP